MTLTPMMQQYQAIKAEHQDSILFFRLGDFYEMFYEDALIGSRDMEIALTKRGAGGDASAPMCGVPYHAADTYIARLIEKGHKVAICEQVEDPAEAKGIVRREVVRIITPGTVLNPSMLAETENNFLASLYVGEEGQGIAYCDISTGEFAAVSFPENREAAEVLAELEKIAPREILFLETQLHDEAPIGKPDLQSLAHLTAGDPEFYTERSCRYILRRHFDTKNESSLGLDRREAPLLFFAVGALLNYLNVTQKQDMRHLQALRLYTTSAHMSLDRATLRHLEITDSLSERRGFALLHILDKTRTAMGSRMMKRWLKEPLVQKSDIDARLEAVSTLVDSPLALNNIREAVRGVYDLERLASRIACGTANGRDMQALKNSIHALPDLKVELSTLADPLLSEYGRAIDDLRDVYELVDKALLEEPPITLRDGNLIRAGYSAELDGLRDSISGGRNWIATLEPKERERTGIKSLKVGYNKVFGYYIDVSKANTHLVPEHYVRKQTLVNSERYITEELKQVESVVLSAEAKIHEMEYGLFCDLRETVARRIPEIQRTSAALAAVDVLASFADVSAKLGYTKPVISEEDRIVIRKGRHPVIEQTIQDGVFVSNDVYLDRDRASLLLITGPNMSGKSTYMRQVALIVLLAQSGCFVPAEHAEIGLCDRIYTRIGASDNIAEGQSTFYVEMAELAHILHTATDRSLVILDEIGRGTSTYDGLSIAWAVCERLTQPENKVRTLFATHYHELTALSETLTGLRNVNVDVLESEGNIVFLHKIVEGSASRSYGIHVARLAGVPESVLQSAAFKLAQLEQSEGVELPAEGRTMEVAEVEPGQLSLFDGFEEVLHQKLLNIDLMETTPAAAIEILQELQREAKEREGGYNR